MALSSRPFKGSEYMPLAKTNIEVCQPGLIKLLTSLKIAQLNLQVVFYIVAYYNRKKCHIASGSHELTHFSLSIFFLLGILLLLFFFSSFFLFLQEISFYSYTVNPRLDKGDVHVMFP